MEPFGEAGGAVTGMAGIEFGGEGGVEAVLFFEDGSQPAHEGIGAGGLFHAGNVARMRDKSRDRP